MGFSDPHQLWGMLVCLSRDLLVIFPCLKLSIGRDTVARHSCTAAVDLVHWDRKAPERASVRQPGVGVGLYS
jgi:hypothetical protein